MAKSAGIQRDDIDLSGEAYNLTIKWDGELAANGELPAAELGAALQGWDRFLQLAYYSQQTTKLELPPSGTSARVQFRVREVRKGSYIVEASIVAGGVILKSVLGNAPYDAIKALWKWSATLVKTHIKAKRERKTLDGVVEELEKVAKENEIRISVDREDTEDFAAALDNALDNATVPLDSSAATEVLTLKGQTLDIVIDEQGRAAIKMPFEPPALDPDADEVIEAPVKFVRINKKTGYGLMSFARPRDASQLSQQRFHCQDKTIKRRANPYTGSFHTDVPLVVKMQRKNYAAERRGHYWLILGIANPVEDDLLPFAKAEKRKKGKKGLPKKDDK
ncbi:MAG: hypothetical protein K2W85_17320 [Phycisphaerales bacterium]|nr:hypothetical protein [Phycisphaerales bacterium]